MRLQMSVDPGWPPDYAKSSDLAEWLQRPATLGRWVAVDDQHRIVGHVGLGAVGSGPVADDLCAELACRTDQLAEICRIVVDPDVRMQGLAGLLTRKAMRASIEAALVPIATVLENRGAWLQMMLATGWRSVGKVGSQVQDVDLVVLAPPRKFVDLALAGSRQ